MGRLDGKVGLVTGGGRGIGRGIALALAKEGCDIAIAELDLAGAEAVAKEIEALGRRALAVSTGVSGCVDHGLGAGGTHQP